jgi:hypothetical protein
MWIPVREWLLDPAVIVLSFLPALGAIAIAVARTRVAPETGRFDVFLARLRTGSTYAMQALVILYLLSMVAAIPVTVQANRAADEVFMKEVQRIWDYQPPAR